jgi:hypothetical protein
MIRRRYRTKKKEGTATQILFRPGKKFKGDKGD